VTESSDSISPKQREFVAKLMDDRESSVEALNALLVAVKGKRLEALNRAEASGLITLLLGQDRPRGRGFAPRR
jgi:hypothetical protein